MPFTQLLPAVQVEWLQEIVWPGVNVDWRNVASVNADADQAWTRGVQFTASQNLLSAGSSGGSGAEVHYRAIQHRPAVKILTTGADAALAFCFPWWSPVFDSGLLNTGTRLPATSVVGLFEIMVQTGGSPPPFTNDAGAVFVGYQGTALGSSARPGASSGQIGFGLEGFDQGGGAQGWRYTSRDAAGTLLDSADYAVPDAGDWATLSFLIQSALPGQDGSLTVYAAGQSIATDTFGSATLPDPYDSLADATMPGLILYNTNTSGHPLNFSFRARFGRFLPSGQAVQRELT